MRVRDIIGEIIEVRKRRLSNSSYSESFERLLSLEKSFKTIPENNYEILKYFPIALVATMEGCFRVMVAELIDQGQPFLDNCDQLLKNQKITFDLIKAFQGQRISLGEFVSHVVSINRLPDIDGLLSTITGRNFLKELETHHSRWDIEILGKKDAPIIVEPDIVYKNVSRTFELRHIFCHETATNVSFDYKEIEACFLSVSIFIKASVDYIHEIIEPDYPLTQLDINSKSLEKLKNIKHNANKIKGRIIKELSRQPERIPTFKSSHKKWLEYMREFSNFSADAYKGGSISSLIYSNTSCYLYDIYLGILNKELKNIEEENTY